MADVIAQFHDKWQKTVESFKIDISSIRSNRVSPVLIEDVMVEAYAGQQMAIKQLAAISAPSPSMLVVQPWDQSTLPAIAKALQDSPIGVMPTSESSIIRLNFPPLTEEKREALLKVMKQKIEEHKIQFRQLRDDVRKEIQKMTEAKEIGEDEKFQYNDRLQKEVDAFNARIEEIAAKKETEIMTV